VGPSIDTNHRSNMLGEINGNTANAKVEDKQLN
jgi:hypothetical protein